MDEDRYRGRADRVGVRVCERLRFDIKVRQLLGEVVGLRFDIGVRRLVGKLGRLRVQFARGLGQGCDASANWVARKYGLQARGWSVTADLPIHSADAGGPLCPGLARRAPRRSEEVIRQ